MENYTVRNVSICFLGFNWGQSHCLKQGIYGDPVRVFRNIVENKSGANHCPVMDFQLNIILTEINKISIIHAGLQNRSVTM